MVLGDQSVEMGGGGAGETGVGERVMFAVRWWGQLGAACTHLMTC
jgi:hypothetical protein